MRSIYNNGGQPLFKTINGSGQQQSGKKEIKLMVLSAGLGHEKSTNFTMIITLYSMILLFFISLYLYKSITLYSPNIRFLQSQS